MGHSNRNARLIMDLRAICRDLPGSNPIPSTSDVHLNNASDSESGLISTDLMTKHFLS